jgi:hypothetical protein
MEMKLTKNTVEKIKRIGQSELKLPSVEIDFLMDLKPGGINDDKFLALNQALEYVCNAGSNRKARRIASDILFDLTLKHNAKRA